MFVYLAGALVCLVAVIQLLPDGVAGAMAAARARASSRSSTRRSTRRGLHVVGGRHRRRVLTLATHGTDPLPGPAAAGGDEPTRRRDRAHRVRLLVMAQFVCSCSWARVLGVLRRPSFARGDEVLPTFVSTELPGALVGFILAAVVAAALSPSLNSMAATTVRDVYPPYFRPAATDAQQMRVGRVFTVIWGVLQMAVAVAAQGIDSALQDGLAALSYASGPIVGAFLLGVLTRSANSAGTMTGMVVGLAVSLSVEAPGAGHVRPPGWPGRGTSPSVRS